MNTLALKLALTPALIGAASLAGRRWGPAVSGSLVGLPLTSGPIVLFVALDHGAAFAAATATGILAGAASTALYCLVYAFAAYRLPWPACILSSTLVFAGATLALQAVTPVLPLALLALGVAACLVAALRLLPVRPSKPREATPPTWDIPARMLIATAFVVALTGAAPALGPHLSGLLAPFPLFTSILVVFAHQLQGPEEAALVLRGVLLGLFGFAAFFVVAAALLQPAGLLVAFVLASASALALQAASLRILRTARALSAS